MTDPVTLALEAHQQAWEARDPAATYDVLRRALSETSA